MSELDDREWLLLHERGENVSHVPASRRAKYDQLARLLEELPGEVPSPGWKQRILARLDEPPARNISAAAPDETPAQGDFTPPLDEPPAQLVSVAPGDDPPARSTVLPRRRRTHRRAWAIMGGLAMAAAIAIALVVALHGGRTDQVRHDRVVVAAPVRVSTDAGPLVTTEIRRGDRPHRSGSGSISIGDSLVIHVTTDRPTELRVYGDTGEPLARCSETQGCTVEHDDNIRRVRLELVLRTSGDVRAVLFTGASIPEAFHSLNADVEAAQRADTEVRQIAVVHVQ